MFFSKKFYNQKGFSILEVMVAVSLLSIVLVSAVSYTSFLMRNMTYNQNKMYATRYVEDLKEWTDGERVADWNLFSGKAAPMGNTYCFNSDLGLSTVFPVTPAPCNLFNGITSSSAPKIFKRELKLRGDSNTVTATFSVSWQQDGKDYKEEAVTIYTTWQ